jgi:phenylalanyl-tRNA synthetase beta chain
LNQEDLMICDNKKAHCIAGVFGGIDSGVEDQTTNVFIESAYFDPISIRKTAKRHGLNTDASFRFERGIDPEIGVYALKRAAILIRDLAGGIISSDIQEVTRPLEEPSKIFLSYTELNKTIGQEIDEKKLNAILNALEIEINSVSESGIGMTIPRYRVDVTRPADVIEEILRIYGYNKILDIPLKYEASPAYQWKSLHKLESTIANKLNGQGFMETVNNSLTNPNASGDFYNPVRILNPLGKELSIMRQSLTINALQVIAFNLNRQNKNLKLYEFGNIYGVKDNNYHESKRLTLSLVGLSFNSHWDLKNPPNLFFYGKGVLIDLFQSLGYDYLNFNETNHPDFDIAFELIHRKNSYGYFGLISKKLKETYSVDEDVYIADLDWNKITEKAFLNPLKYEDVPRFPVMKRDFALLIDKEVSFESLENISYKTERKILKSVQLFDVFQDEKLPKEKKSYGITFTFQDQNKTLTDKHIDKIMEKLKGNFIKEFNAELR